MHRGYIKLWRKMLDWTWVDDDATFSFFIKLILMANHETKNWRNIEVPRGSFVSSIRKMSNTLKRTPQQVRTLIERLKSTQELTHKSTRKFTMYTIVNYELYQDKEIKSTQELTHKSTRISTRVPTQMVTHIATTTKEYKKLKELKELSSEAAPSERAGSDSLEAKEPGQKAASPVHVVLNHFTAKHLETFSEPVHVNWGKDGALAKRLIATFETAERVCELVDRFFASRDEFILQSGHSFGVFAGCVNKLTKTAAASKGETSRLSDEEFAKIINGGVV